MFAKTKKFPLLALALALSSSLTISAFAANSYQTEVSFSGTGEEAYYLTVPASLKPGAEDDVTLYGTWANNRTFSVTADKSVTMRSSFGDEITLDIDFDGISLSGNNVSAVSETQPVSVENMTALFGTWSGSFYYYVGVPGSNSGGSDSDDSEDSLVNQVVLNCCSSAQFLDLCDATNEQDSLMHWENMGTYVTHPSYPELGDGSCTWHTHMGYVKTYLRTAQLQRGCRKLNDCGFRPSFEGKDSESIDAQHEIGDYITIGTLYMGDTPVKVPQNPVEGGDIMEYIDGTKLTLREALDDEAYQLKAFYTGAGTFVADRVMLIQISPRDVFEALS